MRKGHWDEAAFRNQLSEARDFGGPTQVETSVALCCGHRTGCNLLGEALYETGCAGDPMEYFDLRFMRAYAGQRDVQELDVWRLCRTATP